MAASHEQLSPHVLASTVVKANEARDLPLALPEAVEKVTDQEIRGKIDGHAVAVGEAAWVGVAGNPTWAKAARRRARLDGMLTVFVPIDGEPAGVVVLEDPIRTDAARTVRALRQSSIERIVMVTGDRHEVAETVGAVVDVDDVAAERSPRHARRCA